MELSRQEYFSESPFPSPGVPTDTGIKLRSPGGQILYHLSQKESPINR